MVTITISLKKFSRATKKWKKSDDIESFVLRARKQVGRDVSDETSANYEKTRSSFGALFDALLESDIKGQKNVKRTTKGPFRIQELVDVIAVLRSDSSKKRERSDSKR
jgi:translation initiation factor 2 alpha subunit (eIF-2alpha)